MKYHLYKICIYVACCLLLSGCGRRATIETMFTPGDDIRGMIIKEIKQAKKRIHVMAYTFTSKPIANALIEARKRGLEVVVILDKRASKSKRSVADLLSRGGVDVRIDGAHAIAHNKILIFDSSTVINGSYNLTESAQTRNAENTMTVRRDARSASEFEEYFEKHFAHIVPYVPTPEELSSPESNEEATADLSDSPWCKYGANVVRVEYHAVPRCVRCVVRILLCGATIYDVFIARP